MLARHATGAGNSFHNWRDICREANSLQLDDRYDDSLGQYRRALQLTEAEKLSAVNIDIQLNMVQVLIWSNHLIEADRLLAAVKEKIDKNGLGNDLIEMRYWRRKTALESALGRVDACIAAHRHVLECAVRTFGSSGHFYLDEVRLLLVYCLKHRRVDDAIPLARKLESEEKNPMISTGTSVHEYLRACLAREVFDLTVEGNADRAKSLLEQSTFWLPDAASQFGLYTDISGAMAKAGRVEDAKKVARQAISMYPTIKKPTELDATKNAVACLVLAQTKLDFCAPTVEPDLATLINQGAVALDKEMPRAKRNKTILYISLKAHQAWVYAKEGKMREAEEALDQSQPDPDFFTDITSLHSAFQARAYGLLPAYLKAGDMKRFEEQDRKMRALFSSMKKIPAKEKEKLWRQWEGEMRNALAASKK